MDEHDFHFPAAVKVGVFVLSFFALGAVIWQLKARLTLDLPDFSSEDLAALNPSNLLEQSEEELRQQDSDQDGLNDYDELRVYGSSPYIADSDSDGIKDDQEIAAGTDPNCPVGKNCFAELGMAATENKNPLSAYVTEEIKLAANDPVKLRQLLIKGGADANLVNSLDDQTIQILAQQAIVDLSGNTPEKQAFLQNLDAGQIRQLLKSFGLSDAQIAELSDEELVEVYQKALEQAQTNTQE